MSSDCLFCRICREEIPARIVYRDEDCVAFHDLSPVAPTHVLVIPTRHLASLAEVAAEDAALIGRLMFRVTEIARSLGLADGYRVVANTGESAGQSVLHLHFHLLAGRSLSWPPG